MLDMNAPEGAQIVVSVPTADGTNAPLFSLVKGKCPPKCNWDIKPTKKFFDDGGSACRVSAVNTNGDLLDSFTATDAEAAGDSLLTLAPEPGVDQFPVSFLFDAAKGRNHGHIPGQCGAPALQRPALSARLGRHDQGPHHRRKRSAQRLGRHGQVSLLRRERQPHRLHAGEQLRAAAARLAGDQFHRVG